MNPMQTMDRDTAKNLAAFLLGQLAQHPPDQFVACLARMLDEQRARPVLLPTTDAALESAAEAAFIASCEKQFPPLHPGSIAAISARSIFFAGFKAAFEAFVGSP